MLKKVQAVESQLSDDAQLKKHRPVGVVVDNATRWLSQFLMIERALVLRPFYNSFVQRASNEWEKVNLTRAGHIKKGSVGITLTTNCVSSQQQAAVLMLSCAT